MSNGMTNGMTKFLGMVDGILINTILLGITCLIILILLYYIGVYTILKKKIENLNDILLRNSIDKSKYQSL